MAISFSSYEKTVRSQADLYNLTTLIKAYNWEIRYRKKNDCPELKRSTFLDHVRKVIHTNQLSYSTEKTYVNWIYRFIVFQFRRHPGEMGGKEIADFLTNLTG